MGKFRAGKIKPKYRLFFMALPFIIFVFAFAYVPIFGWMYGFFDYKPGLALSDMEFVGLKNFMKIFTDWRDLSRVLRNTLVMSGLGLLAAPIPMFFAIFLNEIRRPFFKKFVQTKMCIRDRFCPLADLVELAPFCAETQKGRVGQFRLGQMYF